MIRRIRCYQTKNTVPYQNLAAEEYLLNHVEEGECILYLWQNRKTVVIGRNQNAWKECRTGELEADGGYLVRRLSGGGAVFHDLGNLNFTFLMRSEDYHLNRQLSVIVRAVNALGIPAELSGRNDIIANGRKFSGNAFYHAEGRSYHHGTLLVDVDMSQLSRYLNVSIEKLKSKGVDSVKSRVVNLSSFQPDITVELVAEKLAEAFGEVYGLPPEAVREDEFESGALLELTEKFSSWDWKFGRRIAFEAELSNRFSWGDLQIQLVLNAGKVEQAQVYSDSMDVEFIRLMPQALTGRAFTSRDLADALEKIPAPDDLTQKMRRDIRTYLLSRYL